MLGPQLLLADYNISGPLNALLKPIQEMDTLSVYGQRSVCISRNPGLLEGFNLNKRTPFDSIVRNPVSYELSHDQLVAKVIIPQLLPGINFYVPEKYPLYRFTIVLGTVPDLQYTGYGYQPARIYQAGYKAADSEWYHVLKGSPALVLETETFTAPFTGSFSAILSIGIQFGTMGGGDTVQQIKYAGSGKVLGMR
jgi:hypothetical protein